MKHNNVRPKATNSRKAIRQNKRLQKKINRNEHYTNKKKFKQIPNIPGQFVKLAIDSEEKLDLRKKKKKQSQPTFLHEILQKERQKDKKKTDALKAQMDERRKNMLTQANEEENKMIKKLEKQLGLSKSKNKTKLFTDDGLDYLLEICDRTTQEQVVAAEKHLANVDDESDFEEDLAVITGNTRKSKKVNNKSYNVEGSDMSDDNDDDDYDDDDDDNNDEEDDDNNDEKDDNNDKETEDNMSNSYVSESEGSDEELENENIKMMSGSDDDEGDLEMSDITGSDNELSSDIKNKAKSNKKAKNNLISEDVNDSNLSELDDKEEDNNDLNDTSDVKETVKPDVWEDIYGRKRDKEGKVIKEDKGVYIPPHLRNKDPTSDKDLTQLKRQIKSVLNKIAGTNLHWACSTIENLYGTNSRHSVSSTLCSLWQDATVQLAATPDRLMSEHAALIAVLQANVGVEIGAHFLEVLVKRFDEMMKVEQPVENKELDNLISALAHLYSFKIYHANLLYDILGRLLTKLTEKNIECVLVALRTVGGVLRKEEPAALRTFIHDTQGKVTGASMAASDGSRIKFLLDVLLAVKNNNLTKIPNYDPSYSEHLKKTIRSVIRKGNYVTALNVRLDDLLKADERGKWWVVGSAWEGDSGANTHDNKKAGPSYDQKLLELARQQRMNTDIRRSIFCVLMSAEDYMDGFDKLEHLGLKGPQQREIAHVLMVCLLNEKTYNPYYSVLARKLCEYDRKHKLSFQYTIWDRIKDLDSLSKSSMAIFSKFIIHLIMDTALPLSVLKVIEFSDLNKNTVRFMRQILLTIIVHPDTESVNGIFVDVATSPKLKMFRDSLRLFIQHFVRRYTGKKTNKYSESEMELLKMRTMEIDNILA